MSEPKSGLMDMLGFDDGDKTVFDMALTGGGRASATVKKKGDKVEITIRLRLTCSFCLLHSGTTDPCNPRSLILWARYDPSSELVLVYQDSCKYCRHLLRRRFKGQKKAIILDKLKNEDGFRESWMKARQELIDLGLAGMLHITEEALEESVSMPEKVSLENSLDWKVYLGFDILYEHTAFKLHFKFDPLLDESRKDKVTSITIHNQKLTGWLEDDDGHRPMAKGEYLVEKSFNTKAKHTKLVDSGIENIGGHQQAKVFGEREEEWG